GRRPPTRARFFGVLRSIRKNREGVSDMRRTVLAGVVCAAPALAMPRADGKRFITETDLLKFTWIADPQISPDGSRVVFVRVTVDEKENRYQTSLFAVATDNPDAPRRLTSGMRDTSPRWSPDAKQIAFV